VARGTRPGTRAKLLTAEFAKEDTKDAKTKSSFLCVPSGIYLATSAVKVFFDVIGERDPVILVCFRREKPIDKAYTVPRGKPLGESEMMINAGRTVLKCMLAVWLAVVLAPIAGSSAQTKQDVDLVVSGGIVVTMDGGRRILHDGSVAVKGDTIVAVGRQADLEEQYRGARTIDAHGKLVLPGFINGHTHVPMTLFRGLHDDVTLNDWLYKYIFPAEAKNVNEEFVRWGTRLAAAEQIRSGVTTFADMYYFEDAVAEETKAAGMRGVLGETFIDFPAPDNKSNAEMLAYTEKFLKKWQGDPLIHAAPAPHSIYTCSKKTIQDAAALARKYHAPVLMHVSEMKKEWEDSEKANGMSPVQYLEKIGVLGPDLVAAHCIFVDAADRKLLADRQVGCVHNPSSNMMIASGVSPVPEMRAAGVAVGLGTDGPAGSNNDLDLMEEIDLAAKLAKI
jgi:5-methylthioadenosine/S-adenosylhomocysteine deaminase